MTTVFGFSVLILILAVFVFLIVNSGVFTYKWLKTVFEKISPKIFGIAFGFVMTLIVVLFILSRLPNTFIPRFLLKLSHQALGVFIYYILFVNLVALVFVIVKALKLLEKFKPKTVSIAALSVCAVLIIGLSAYGIINAGRIDTVKYTVTLNGQKSDNVKGFKIALVSDLHLGQVIDAQHLEKVVKEINKTNPDMVCFAGDIFDGDMTAVVDKAEIKKVFRSIKSNYGVYACFGNHDAGESYSEMVEFLADCNVKLLEDEYAVVDNRFILVGRRDSSPIGGRNGIREDVKLPAENKLPVIVLDHQPNNYKGYYKNADLILCGHTHLGQIFPANIIVNFVHSVPYGYYREDSDSPQVIVTSGAGTWGPPMRVGSNNEIAEITLQ